MSKNVSNIIRQVLAAVIAGCALVIVDEIRDNQSEQKVNLFKVRV